MQKIAAFVLIISFLFTSACKKAESPDAVDPARNGTHFPGPKASILIAKEWKLTDKTVTYNNGLPTEDFTNVPDCVKDNVISFVKEKVYTVDESIDVCPNAPKTTTYNWTTENEEQTLVLNNKSWQVISLTDNEMIIRYTTTSASLTAITTEKYTAQ